jgi:cytochrome c oxidase subunit 2
MRLIGWAIALAAAGLTPAAAQTAASPPAQSTPAAPAATATPPAGTAQDAAKPDAAQPAIVPGSVGHAIPTPGVGEPDGRKGIQLQVTPIGEEAVGFHDYWLLPLCAIISVFVLALLLYAIVRFRRGANPTPSRNSHNTLIEVIWTLVPVLILVGIAIPSIRLLRHQYSPPPADVTVKVTGHQWYWSYELPDYGVSFDSYMLKEANDPTRQANQRARTDNDGPPLLAVDNRLVIPQGKVVKFIVTADDVIHSFAMPAFWIKQDANPGQLHETWAKVDRAYISVSVPSFAVPAMASCQSPSRWFPKRSSRNGWDRTAATCLALSQLLARRRLRHPLQRPRAQHRRPPSPQSNSPRPIRPRPRRIKSEESF